MNGSPQNVSVREQAIIWRYLTSGEFTMTFVLRVLSISIVKSVGRFKTYSFLGSVSFWAWNIRNLTVCIKIVPLG